MSLISQNAVSKTRLKTKTEDGDVSSLVVEENKDVEDVKESDLESSWVKKRKREKERRLETEQVKEMRTLESFLFGSLYDPVEFGKEDEEKVQDEAETGSAMYFVDHSANSMLSGNEDDAPFSEESNEEDEILEKKPVWVDEEEEKTNVNIAKVNRLRKLRKEEDESLISGVEYVSRLRAQHVKLNPGTEWAQLGSRLRDDEPYDESSDEENQVTVARGYEDVQAVDDILRTNEDLVVKSGAKLSTELLEYSRLVDGNAEEPSNGPINSV